MRPKAHGRGELRRFTWRARRGVSDLGTVRLLFRLDAIPEAPALGDQDDDATKATEARDPPGTRTRSPS